MEKDITFRLEILLAENRSLRSSRNNIQKPRRVSRLTRNINRYIYLLINFNSSICFNC